MYHKWDNEKMLMTTTMLMIVNRVGQLGKDAKRIKILNVNFFQIGFDPPPPSKCKLFENNFNKKMQCPKTFS